MTVTVLCLELAVLDCAISPVTIDSTQVALPVLHSAMPSDVNSLYSQEKTISVLRDYESEWSLHVDTLVSL